MRLFKVIVAGGRDFDDYPMMVQYLDFVFSETKEDIEIVCGMARGADSLGKRYAEERGYAAKKMAANWSLHGRSAGYVRNVEMANYADALVAFWDGKSSGTAHMIKTAQSKHLKIRVKRY